MVSGDTFAVKGTIDMQQFGVGLAAPWGATTIDNPTMPMLLNLGTLDVDNVAPEYSTPPLMPATGPSVITGDLYNVDGSAVNFISTGGVASSALNVEGDYSQATAYGAPTTPGVLNMRIGGATFGNDQLMVGGVATLGGTLNVLPGSGAGGGPWALLAAAAFAANGSGIPYDFAYVNLFAGNNYLGLGLVN